MARPISGSGGCGGVQHLWDLLLARDMNSWTGHRRDEICETMDGGDPADDRRPH